MPGGASSAKVICTLERVLRDAPPQLLEVLLTQQLGMQCKLAPGRSQDAV